jgi:hypothetical protein
MKNCFGNKILLNTLSPFTLWKYPVKTERSKLPFNDERLAKNYKGGPKNCDQESNGDVTSGLERPVAVKVDIPPISTIEKCL